MTHKDDNEHCPLNDSTMCTCSEDKVVLIVELFGSLTHSEVDATKLKIERVVGVDEVSFGLRT